MRDTGPSVCNDGGKDDSREPICLAKRLEIVV